MKTKLYTPVLALLLLAGASGAALAQDRDHEHSQAAPQGAPHPGGPPGGGAPGGGHRDGSPQGAPQGAPAAQPQRPPGDRFSPQAHGFQGPPPGAAPPQRFDHDHDHGQGPGAPGGGPRPFDHERGPNVVVPPGAAGDRGGDRGHDGRPDGRDGRWDGHNGPGGGGGHGPPQRWQPGRYPPVFWSHDRFHAGAYRAPYGYYVRSWAFGDFLPRGWFGDPYWINDFIDYDLPYPPPGYEWVRVGPDALMIDRYTGRIVQVVRGIFW